MNDFVMLLSCIDTSEAGFFKNFSLELNLRDLLPIIRGRKGLREKEFYFTVALG